MNRLKEEFVKKYNWIMMRVGPAYSYLGMQIILQDSSAMIDMHHFIDKLLATCGENDLEKRTSPAGKDIFTVDPKASMLDEKMRRSFHTNVAKLLYSTKRARPDIMMAIGFLCTHVTKATVHDQKKSCRVLGYLLRTKEWVLTFTPKI